MNSYRFVGTRIDTGERVSDQVSADCEEAARAALVEKGIACDTMLPVEPWPTRLQWRLLGWASATIIVLACILLGFAVHKAREAANEAVCRGHMVQLRLALLNYHAEHGHFPPAYVSGPDGRPWHSWRVLVLPHLGEEEVFRQYRFDEPWNGPNNRALADMIEPMIFQCPSADVTRASLVTNYCVVVGEDTFFPGGNRWTAIDDGDVYNTDDFTIVLVEVTDSDIHWMEPRDLEIDQVLSDSASTRIGSQHPGGIGIARANGRVERLSPHLPPRIILDQFVR